MKTITAENQRLFKQSASEIYAVLLDVNTYAHWFPEQVKIEILDYKQEGVGTTYKMASGPISWSTEVLEVVANERISMKYFDGPLVGSAEWILNQTAEGTDLRYVVSLKPKGMMMTMLAGTMDIAKLQGEQMEKIYNGLEQFLTSKP